MAFGAKHQELVIAVCKRVHRSIGAGQCVTKTATSIIADGGARTGPGVAPVGEGDRAVAERNAFLLSNADEAASGLFPMTVLTDSNGEIGILPLFADSDGMAANHLSCGKMGNAG